MINKVRREVEELRDQIRMHDRKYYVENTPEITDYEYDLLINDLKELEKRFPELVTPDSPTQRVGGEPITSFNSVEHKIPMLSIDNTYSEDELREFDKRIRRLVDNKDVDVEYVIEHKIDGIAISLWYENGVFVRGVTRGDGIKGDDVTVNIKTIKGLPLRISNFDHILGGNYSTKSQTLSGGPCLLEVRGEVYLPDNDFQRLNNEREESDKPLFANPRNAAAGSLKLFDPRVAAKRRLHLFVYDIGYSDGLNISTHIETLEFIQKLGLPVNHHYKLCGDIEGVIKTCNKWETKRRELSFQVDGMVIKVNTLKLRQEMGATSKAPRWLISYKFHPEQVITRIVDIVVQVGKSGTLTPVANLEPVSLAGSTVSRATLHNFDEIKRKDIRAGDYVTIQKAGDIIPQVVGVVKEKRNGDEETVKVPVKCPVCDSEVSKSETEVYIRCTNLSCPAQSKRRIAYFASRDCMDIEGLGPALVEQLVDEGLLEDYADIFSLKLDQLLGLDRMAEKSSKNLLNSIEKSKNRDLSNLICALGISNVGSHASELLANRFGSIEKLSETGQEALESIPEIGSIMANNIIAFFQNPGTVEIVQKLKEANVNTKSLSGYKEFQTSGISGKAFVITGTLEKYPRKDLEKLIKESGGKVSSSVSKKTNYLIVGDSPGSKLQKAMELGVDVINESEFEAMVTSSF